VICVDVSTRALDVSRSKLGSNAEFHEASILALPFADGVVDAVLCVPMLYHVEAARQATGVRELIRVTKPGGRLVVYGNPHAPFMLVQTFLKALRINRLLKKNKLYFHSHPKSWWRQFETSCRITVVPFNSISKNQERSLLFFPPARRIFFSWCASMEARHPESASRLWSYVAVVMDKR
jgi:ubiquinone/menaquinone biosynthesis C-methylase UbiE